MAINSGKYKIENNQIVNIATGVAIPDDEPVFILRAKDDHAVDAILQYAIVLGNRPFAVKVAEVFEQFKQWASQNEDKMKEPD